MGAQAALGRESWMTVSQSGHSRSHCAHSERPTLLPGHFVILLWDEGGERGGLLDFLAVSSLSPVPQLFLLLSPTLGLRLQTFLQGQTGKVFRLRPSLVSLTVLSQDDVF